MAGGWQFDHLELKSIFIAKEILKLANHWKLKIIYVDQNQVVVMRS